MPQVADSTVFPYNCIGLLLMNFDDGNSYWGTGALINAQYILTAGHNLFDYEDQHEITSAVFYRAYNSAGTPVDGGIRVEKAFVPHAFMRGNQPWDIGVMRLERAIAGAPFMTPVVVTEAAQVPTEPILTGFPGDHHFVMWQEQETTSAIDIAQHVFAYTHDSSQGSSGSPLYAVANNTCSIYGVHTQISAGNDDDKLGVLITMPVAGFIMASLQHVGGDAFLYNLQD
ncbi:MAG: trypsin-like serine peptidase [Caulobacteraceae bacterium]